MSSRYPIRDVYIHPEIVNDLAEIAQSMTQERFHEFYYGTFQNAIATAMANPFLPNTELRFQLEGWSRLDFHSMMNPPRKMKRDYRFVYKYEQDGHDFYQLAVGLRNAKGVSGTSIYHKAQIRPKAAEIWRRKTE